MTRAASCGKLIFVNDGGTVGKVGGGQVPRRTTILGIDIATSLIELSKRWIGQHQSVGRRQGMNVCALRVNISAAANDNLEARNLQRQWRKAYD